MSKSTDRSTWSLETLIDHACSLAIGYGAGRDDVLEDYRATKEQALRMARHSRVGSSAPECGTCGETIRPDRLVGTACGCSPLGATDWRDRPQTDLEVAIAEFKAKLPGWWYSVCECQVSCDASCAPTTESSHIDLIQTDEKGLVLRRDDPFDSGFHADLPQPSSLAEALRDVMNQALTEIENRKGIANV